MHEIHRRNILIRTLVPSSIFLDQAWEIGIGEFAWGKSFRAGDENTAGMGSPVFIAPEIWRNEKDYDLFLADVYAYGVIVYYAFSKSYLTRSHCNMQVMWGGLSLKVRGYRDLRRFQIPGGIL